MTPRIIHRFFKLLDRELGRPSKVILTGAACGSLMGHIRPSLDIDFEIRFQARVQPPPVFVESAIRAAAAKVGVAVNYAGDISRWSMVSYLDYRRTALPYRDFGKCEVRLIAPEYWTIGKMTRFLEPDVRDMVRIIKKKKLKADALLKVWSRALRSSELSAEARLFRDHVRTFLKLHAKRIWGTTADPDTLTQRFDRLFVSR